MSKSIKGICIIKELGNIIPRNYLIAIYKSFVRLHFVYGNLIFDQSNNEHFSQQTESIPYNASLAITSVIKGLSRFKLYNEKYFHSVLLSLDDDSENFVPFTKLEVLVYLDAESSQMYNTSSLSDIIHHYTAFFLSTISKCNKLDLKIHQFKTLFTFQSALIKLGRPISKTVFNIHNSVGLMFLTRLIIGLSHLNQRQFSHNFQDCLNSLHSCCLEVESVFFFFLHYHKQALNQRSIWS